MDWAARQQLTDVGGPTCMTPDAMAPAGCRTGPVLLALLPDPHASGAVAHARQLARDLHRPLMIGHAPPVPSNEDLMALPKATALQWERYQRTSGLGQLAEFMHEHDLDGIEVRLRNGSPAAALAGIAQREHAAVIVCGSRLASHERGFTGNTVRELVRTAQRPVIAVPPAMLAGR